jgi:hypothetical protein
MKTAACRLAILLSISLCAPAAALASAPGQFVARHHTEALGMAPAAAEWRAALDALEAGGCTAATLKAFSKTIYVSPGYESLDYSNAERVLTAFRGILAREPDAAGFVAAVEFLDGGGAWPEWLDLLYDGAEFSMLVPVYCTGGSAGAGTVAALASPARSEPGESLQGRLAAASPGEVVLMRPGWVTELHATLLIPPGVTLATDGAPGLSQYARMGRLVRAAAFDGPLVELGSGAKLVNVWLSGERHVVGSSPRAVNVLLQGTGSEVRGIKSEASAGWTSIAAIGTADGVPCRALVVGESLITNYSGSHESEPADGISVSCEDATVQSNDVVDASDVGIAVFGAGAAEQRSVVTDNRVIAAGLSAYAALAFLPDGTADRFTDASMSANELWTSATQHFDIGIAVGSAPWADEVGMPGAGAIVTNNGTANLATNLDAAVVVDGMRDATVLGNALLRVPAEVSDCPSGDVLADVAAADASGLLQPYAQARSHACLGHGGARVAKTSMRRMTAPLAMPTGSRPPLTASHAGADTPADFMAVYRGRICVADEAGVCHGADASTDRSTGALIGYVRVHAGPGQVPVYAGSCYANEAGTCTGWGMSAGEGPALLGYAAATAPRGGPAVPLVDMGGLLYHGAKGAAAAYLWPSPPRTRAHHVRTPYGSPSSRTPSDGERVHEPSSREHERAVTP